MRAPRRNAAHPAATRCSAVRWQVMRSNRTPIVLIALAALAAPLLLASCKPAPAPHQAELDVLKANCVQAMVSSTCRVMQGQGVSLIPKDAQTVFVAGIGPIDASLYRTLREQGEGMCQHLASVCERGWAGNQCVTARKLYSPPR